MARYSVNQAAPEHQRIRKVGLLSIRNSFYAFFTFALFGAVFLVTGAIGWEPIKDGGVFLGRGRWVDGPIWSQVGIGAVCLVAAAIAYRFASRDPRLGR